MIRVEAINLLTGRSQNPLRMENLLTAYNLEAASSTECVKHLCCAPQVYSVSFAAFTPLLHALTAVLHYSKKVLSLFFLFFFLNNNNYISRKSTCATLPFGNV